VYKAKYSGMTILKPSVHQQLWHIKKLVQKSKLYVRLVAMRAFKALISFLRHQSKWGCLLRTT